MRLSHLLKDIYSLPASVDCDIADLKRDSRLINKSDLFFAIQGTERDGRQYIVEAIARGASAVLFDANEQGGDISFAQNVPIIPIYQLQKKSALVAACFYGHPSQRLRMIGVTGTSGKTSCTHFIAQILQSLGKPCGIIGTLGNGFYDALTDTGLTTPDSLSLHAFLRQFVQQGALSVAMEVSSHSIHQDRVHGIPFEMGIFTNLTQDHLDYHGDMHAYAQVKHRFLAELPLQHRIINADDPYGYQWIAELAPQQSVFAFSTHASVSLPKGVPLIYSDKTELSLDGIYTRLHTPWGVGEVRLPLLGHFNLSNVLATVTALCLYGIPFNDLLQPLARIQAIPGRMQTLSGRHTPLVVVDYAHKPDALEKVLQALRVHTKGKLICVFGCGGDRDKTKRPLMGRIAEQYADTVIITNDNPRYEQPEEIAAQILHGLLNQSRATILLDRSKAIEKSIQYATENDCVLIAGKGAEHYQQIGDQKILFDDAEQVRKYLGI